jgi:hypothetical protein
MRAVTIDDRFASKDDCTCRGDSQVKKRMACER